MCDEDKCINNSDITFEFEINHNSVAPSDTVERSGKFLQGLLYTRKDHAKYRGDNILPQSHEPDPRPNREMLNKTSSDPDQRMLKSTSSNSIDLPIAIRKGTQSCTKHSLSNFVSYKNLSPSFFAFVSQLEYVSILNNVQKALVIPKWKEVIFDEIRALKNNSNWEKVDLPNGKSVVGCKCVFTTKYNSDGSWKDIKLIWLPKVSPRHMESTTLRHFLQ